MAHINPRKEKMEHRRQLSNEFKAKVAIEAVKEAKTINEIASEHEVHPSQVKEWKRILLEGVPRIFEGARVRKKEEEPMEARLYQQIGQLQVELEWLKKKSGISFSR